MGHSDAQYHENSRSLKNYREKAYKIFLSLLSSFLLRSSVIVTVFFICLQSDDVYLEVQIQNITPGPVYMEHVRLDASNLYQSEELNTLEEKEG